MKIRIGIFFGGSSREREVSFAGGRTVHDNLNKSLFDPVLLFIDSHGNLMKLDWQYIYKGSIRDFYPPVSFIPDASLGFQIYVESLGRMSADEQEKMISMVGERIDPSKLTEIIDFAFLCLHGSNGEDGRIQGILEWYKIPYSGSGILSSSIGINKLIQKQLIQRSGFGCIEFTSLKRMDWIASPDRKSLFQKVNADLGSPLVIKPSKQGSSIGASIIQGNNFGDFEKAVNSAFFIEELKKDFWNQLTADQQVNWIKTITDIREGVGLPVIAITDHGDHAIIYRPDELMEFIISHFAKEFNWIRLEAIDSESDILFEKFIEGKEFSCIVIQTEDGLPVSLPPTEIRKGKELFDYRSKYLPGISRKITPIQIADEKIELIREECEKLFQALFFNVYARIDGFITEEGNVYLNDPNTTSGMMPSSFFFHQAAEIGLNPSQFLTYIIRTSLYQRVNDMHDSIVPNTLLKMLDRMILESHKTEMSKKRIAVIMGGESSERHISVESGRNVFEKISSSGTMEPLPVFLTGTTQNHVLYQIPVNVLLKDNADDIREKAENYKVHPVTSKIMERCAEITEKYASSVSINAPAIISYAELSGKVDGVFIALHGRPGEDGEIQEILEKFNLPYNGSGISSSRVTIDKFKTNELLRQNLLSVADHLLVNKKDWDDDSAKVKKMISDRFSFPLIAKPVDDGCSSAVKKIRNISQFEAFADAIFREGGELLPDHKRILSIKDKEEFPLKQVFLVEELITRKNAVHFLEITGGMLTSFDAKGNIQYEIFEPSESLSEGDVLSLEEKFLAGQGQNITPARFSKNPDRNKAISLKVRNEFEKAARVLNVEGYARIDAFVRIFENDIAEVIFIEVNSLPGMTPATCIFHQCAIQGYKPFDFIEKIIDYGFQKRASLQSA
jgi:UDP-N-acetylmuramate--alanine ligase